MNKLNELEQILTYQNKVTDFLRAELDKEIEKTKPECLKTEEDHDHDSEACDCMVDKVEGDDHDD